MMKKHNVLSLVLAFCLCFMVAMPAWATEMVEEENPFNITQTVKNNVVTRVYERDSNDGIELTSDSDYEQTKALLSEMGMEQDFIDELSDEKLEYYSTVPQIMSTVTYVRVEPDGKQFYIDEETALKEAEEINAQMDIMPLTAVEEENRYMRIYFEVTPYGKGAYTHSIDQRWITMPIIRGTDGICSSAKHCHGLLSGASGWYLYNKNFDDGSSIMSGKINIPKSCISTIKDADYGGLGAYFIVAPNMEGSDGYRVSDFKVHFEYISSVDFPDNSLNFAPAATYSHTTVGLTFSPTFGLVRSEGKFGIQLGVHAGVQIAVDNTFAEFETDIQYRPNN